MRFCYKFTLIIKRFVSGCLINILRVILTIMHPSSPNPAPDSVRKAVRAALILTPLFGLQFIFIPVKPDARHPLYTVHQYISMIISSYQVNMYYFPEIKIFAVSDLFLKLKVILLCNNSVDGGSNQSRVSLAER